MKTLVQNPEHQEEGLAALNEIIEDLLGPRFKAFFERDKQFSELERKLNLLRNYPKSERCFQEAFQYALFILDKYGRCSRGLFNTEKYFFADAPIGTTGYWGIDYTCKDYRLIKSETLEIIYRDEDKDYGLMLARMNEAPFKFCEVPNKRK
jgi:hypothetical protein